MKKAQNVKLHRIILFSVMFAIIFSQPAFSSLTNSVVIRSSGQIVSRNVYAESGSASDIQSAVNLIGSTGGTVHVPAGTFFWNGETVEIPAGVNVIGASLAGCKGHEDNWEHYTPSTILFNNAAPPRDTPMFYLDGQDPTTHQMTFLKSRISGIQFEATPPANPTDENNEGGTAITIRQAVNYRIDHCTFINFCGTAVGATSNDGREGWYYAYGLIDHCVVDNPYKLTPPPSGEWFWGYGFYSSGNMKAGFDNWNDDVTDFAGKYESIDGCSLMYVEDCHISRTRHAIDAIQGSWNVVRYSLFDNAQPDWGDIDLHGSQSWYGGRGMEVYGNTIIAPSGVTNYYLGGIRLRGGSGFFFDNTLVCDTYSSSNALVCLDTYDYSTTYPFTNIDQTYIWDNEVVNGVEVNPLQGTEDVHYFLREPNQIDDGFSYTPYQYPHPLTLEETF